MKNLIGISAVLVFLLMSACAEISLSETEKEKNYKPNVIALHLIELEAGVDAKEFETFVINEIVPLYQKIDGQDAFLVKGDRGNRTDKYSFVITFDSVEDRDRIYPITGGISEDFQSVLEGTDQLWAKFDSFVIKGIGEMFTDYVRVIPHK